MVDRASPLVVVMGVSGSGKTTVGRAVAKRLGAGFLDADDLHRQEDTRRMERGVAIARDARTAWIHRVRAEAGHLLAADERCLVLACSALLAEHREILALGLSAVIWVHLVAPPEVLARRLRDRSHGVGPALLESQLASLEPPSDAIEVDVSGELDRSVDEVVARLG